MRRLPEGFHIDTVGSTGDGVGLTAEELREERAAARKELDGRRRPRVAATRPPFEIALRECGLYDRVREITQARGVAVVELHCEGRPTKRVQGARKDVYKLLRSLDWGFTDIGRLFSIHHSSVIAALK